jgi:hypothetical protein
MALFQIGDLISFSYPAVFQQGTRAHDKQPNVLVLHNNWGGNMHGLNFNYLSDDEINLLRMLIDPGYQLKYFDNLNRKNPNLTREFERVIDSAGSAVITSPYNFYFKVIKPLIMSRGYDPYRKYNLGKMSSVRIKQKQQVMTGQQRRGLFGTVETRDRGKKEKDILKDLALRQMVKERGVLPGSPSRGKGYTLTPTEERFIRDLHGRSLRLFHSYKNKFSKMYGPRFGGG